MRISTILAASCLLLVSCKKEGCTDPAASNFDPTAEMDNGSCQYDVEGCTDPAANNFDPTAEIDDGSCAYDVEGCTDPEAFNYNPEATLDDGSCVLLVDIQPSIDGYTYAVVQIGDQVWFAENLRTMVYANGDPIPANLSDNVWTWTTSGAMAVYGEDYDEDGPSCSDDSPDIDACDEVQSLAEYGRLYNWYAVNDARGLCPTGWHVPTDEEWTELEGYITSQGFDGTEGTALKSTTGWHDGSNGTDDFGFSALPSGLRINWGNLGFAYAGQYGNWWSSSPNGSDARGVVLGYDVSDIYLGDYNRRSGFSVRCLWDAE